MGFSGGKGLTMVDEFNGKNFNIYKFKLEMVLATNNLWEIVVRKRQYHALSITNNMNTSER